VEMNKIIAITSVLIIGLATFAGAEKEWTRTEILQIADKEAIRIGYDVEHMSVSFDVYNTKWEDYLKSFKGIGGMPDVEKELEEHNNYLAIHFAPFKKMILGGDLWVFIDLDNGEVITVIRGQ